MILVPVCPFKDWKCEELSLHPSPAQQQQQQQQHQLQQQHISATKQQHHNSNNTAVAASLSHAPNNGIVRRSPPGDRYVLLGSFLLIRWVLIKLDKKGHAKNFYRYYTISVNDCISLYTPSEGWYLRVDNPQQGAVISHQLISNQNSLYLKWNLFK